MKARFAVLSASLAFVLSSRVVFAQTPLPPRAAPSLGPLSILGTNITVPNAIATWGSWSVSANPCTEEGKVQRCAVHIGKGNNEPGSICVSNAALHFSVNDSLAVALQPGTKASSANSSGQPLCFTLKAHDTHTLTVVLADNAAKKPLGVSLMLEESVKLATAASSYKARAKVPLIAPTP